MDLAKQHIDVGLFTNQLEPMLRFWQEDVGLPFEELLPLGGGARQHRHAMNGSVFKLNHARDPLPEAPPAGYRALAIATPRVTTPKELRDPDGNPVLLVPPGHEGVVGIRLTLAVRNAAAFDDFYGRVLGFERAGERLYRCGDSLVAFAESPDAVRTETMRAPGYRYFTVQVRDCDADHNAAVARGAEEGQPPRTMGTTARISFLRDPDGNWIEVSQRASLAGTRPLT